MTFKHKLSRRMALLKDRRAIMVAVVLAAAIADCERPVSVAGPGTTLAQLVVIPPTVSLLQNAATDFIAVGLTTAGDTVAVAVDWTATGGSISDSTSGKGMHYGRYKAGGQTGQFKVVAKDPASGLSDSATTIVTATAAPVASVVVLPATATTSLGGTTQFVAIPLDASGTALGGRVVTWASSNSAIATVDASGLATGVAAGSATITATSEGQSGSATLTVSAVTVPVASVSVSPASASVAAGQTVQLTATPQDANGNALTGRTITWASGTTSVATVSGSGLVTGVAAGSATITATSEGKSGSSAITVTAVTVPVASVTVSPASASVAAGQTVQLTATPKDANGNALTGRTITWGSGNTSVATVSSSGLVTGVTGGSATITATSEGKSGSSAITVTAVTVPVATVTVSPATGTVFLGQTLQLTATPKDANGNALTGRTITWASSASSVASVNGSGLVTGQATGSATVTATSEGKSGSAAITVSTPPPPPTGSCLSQSGTLVTLSGFSTSTYETSSLSASTKVDATTAQFLVDQSINVAVRIAGGNGICWSGGEILGQYPPSTPWNTMHDKYGMIPGSGGDANGFQAQNVTVFSYGDGISFDTQNDSNWVVKNVHVKYSRDDCIENDFLNAGTIDSTFLDGCYDGVSAQEYTGSPNGNNNILTMSNSLVRLQSMDAVYGGAVPNHNAFWKWSTIGPSLALYNNVFRADGPSREGNGAQMWMAPPPGKLADCKNNVMVWLGSGSFPETLPTTFNGQPCFTIMTGAAGLQYWNNAVANWFAHHPDPLPDVAPPIVSLFSPGISGSTTLTGTVTIVATANDDRAVVGVQLQLNGQNIGAEVTQDGVSGDDQFGPTHYALTWDSHGVANGTYTLTAVARDAAGHSTTSAGVTVTVSN
ncbi:MAG TPA: Ig-like domain-containing protein [Gemmatimonadales bacterium]|nr:Ig-like domain-containing protein [Gemmatimonadales bacterium]